MTITMPDGLVINLEDYPKDVTAVVQSTGANGATTLLANQLTSLTVLLAEHGVITGEEATGLLELANQGHRIALIERTIEEAYKVSADPAAFAKQPINFEGVVYDSPSDLADLIGEDSADSRDHVERIKFQTLYDKVANSLATREPAVQTLVNDLVRDIINIAESVEASSEEDNYDPAQYQNNIASNATDKDSTQICKLGGNNSGDKFCLR